MQNNIFNTIFEISIRALLLLSVSGSATLDRLTAYDFFATYSKDFGLADYNLHGDNEFSFGELAIRRKKMAEALKMLAADRVIDVKNGNAGFEYQLNSFGWKIGKRLQSTYAKEYSGIAQKVVQAYKHRSEVDLLKIISQRSEEALYQKG